MNKAEDKQERIKCFVWTVAWVFVRSLSSWYSVAFHFSPSSSSSSLTPYFCLAFFSVHSSLTLIKHLLNQYKNNWCLFFRCCGILNRLFDIDKLAANAALHTDTNQWMVHHSISCRAPPSDVIIALINFFVLFFVCVWYANNTSLYCYCKDIWVDLFIYFFIIHSIYSWYR